MSPIKGIKVDMTKAYEDAENATRLFEYMESLRENLLEWKKQADDLDFPGIDNKVEKGFFIALKKLQAATDSIFEKSKSLANSADDEFG